jgi:uncharacterized protein YrrD
MKKSVEIIGLPVISIDEGRELGIVRDVVINPSAKEVSALLLEDQKWFMGARTFPFSAISGIGQYAVTIEKSESVTSVLDSSDLLDLLATEVKIIGSKILTKTGQIQGKIVDIIVDESGKIITCDVEDMNGQMTTISSEQVVTFGKEVTITNDIGQPEIAVAAATATAKPIIVSNLAAPVAKSQQPTESKVATTPSKEQPSDEAAKKFDDRQKKYLLGKKANRLIETDNGAVIIEQGGEITEEVIQKAKLSGKFVELSMSIQ